MTISPYENDIERIVHAVRHPRVIDLTIAPANNAMGLRVTQAGDGSNGGLQTGQNGFGFAYNLIYIRDQRADTGTSPYTYGVHIFYDVGGGLSEGSKYGFRVDAVKQNPQNPLVASNDMVAGVFNALANVNDGGTNTAAGSRGTVFGCSPAGSLTSGATNYFLVSGGEVDCAIRTGASAKYRFGWSITGNGDLQAANQDAALEIGATGTDPGWKTGVLFSSVHGGAPVGTAGTLIGTDGSAVTVAHGVDFSAYTFSTAAWKSPGLTVSPVGDIFINGSISPNIKFGPTSGSTTFGIIYQLGNFVNIGNAGVVDWIALSLATGTATFFGFIEVAGGKYLRVNPVAVASLPAAATAGSGARAFVTNATATTFASVVAGGGTNPVPVYSDGTNWLIG